MGGKRDVPRDLLPLTEFGSSGCCHAFGVFIAATLNRESVRMTVDQMRRGPGLLAACCETGDPKSPTRFQMLSPETRFPCGATSLITESDATCEQFLAAKVGLVVQSAEDHRLIIRARLRRSERPCYGCYGVRRFHGGIGGNRCDSDGWNCLPAECCFIKKEIPA